MMIASAPAREDILGQRPIDSIAIDALTRIPPAYFLDMAWAHHSIESCAAMVTGAACGHSARASGWLADARATADVRPLIAVLHAVCDAIVADDFRARGDVSGVSAFITSLKRDVMGELAIDQRQREFAAATEPAVAQLATGLVRMVDVADREIAVHLNATAAFARRVATAMQLPPAQIATIALAARLHDIGKIGLRSDGFSRPGALTAADRQELQRHPERSATVLGEIPLLAHLAPIVRAHHERMDGRGYPDRLRADEIPFESRVVAVADAFVAMTAPRVYRPAFSADDAIDMLAANAGPQFDADVVAATLELDGYSRRPRLVSA
jgi:HD-GYP domain-containing protein (c-di-GMP phosphodiesterase class II)